MKIRSTGKPLTGEITIPGDKSISHRAVMLGSLANGQTVIRNFLKGADCLSTIDCFRKMGISIHETEDEIIIEGKGLYGLSDPHTTLNVGNSGTTLRLISGILAGQTFQTKLTGDASIQKRPMDRIIRPLSLMGTKVTTLKNNGCAPLTIHGGEVHAIDYISPIASAQVKSCILLAGLYGEKATSVTEPYLSRDHTELMLSYFGAHVHRDGTRVSVEPDPKLGGKELYVPGDISSAAYWIVAALIVPGSDIIIKNVGINPTRNGILTVCQNMGADITLLNETISAGEPVADIRVKYSSLQSTVIEGSIIPALIDEIPVIALLAAFAQGTTIIRDAQELKVKESNRLDLMVQKLSLMGCSIKGTDDGMIIEGGNPLHGITVDSCNDHRIAMTFAIAGLAVKDMHILNSDCVSISYPDFYQQLESFF